MPWEERLSHSAACKVARTRLDKRAPAALQAATRCHPSTQGIGLRPLPWAPFSRPVGPDGAGVLAARFPGR